MSNYLSRKFLLSVAFAVIVCANAWLFGKALDWQGILAIGSVFGVYTVGNVAQKTAKPYDIIESLTR